jgi:hypothetical protein
MKNDAQQNTAPSEPVYDKMQLKKYGIVVFAISILLSVLLIYMNIYHNKSNKLVSMPLAILIWQYAYYLYRKKRSDLINDEKIRQLMAGGGDVQWEPEPDYPFDTNENKEDDDLGNLS